MGRVVAMASRRGGGQNTPVTLRDRRDFHRVGILEPFDDPSHTETGFGVA